jgi:hypothetical protein
MGDDDAVFLIFLAFVAVAHKSISSYYMFFDDLPTVKEKKRLLKRKCDLVPYKRNVSCRYSSATNPLEAKNCLAELLQDSDRAYMKSVTHLHEWQFLELSKKLKDLILHPRIRSNGTRPEGHRKPPKFDHYHHLLFVLRWLNGGLFYRSREADTGYSKSSVHEDIFAGNY